MSEISPGEDYAVGTRGRWKSYRRGRVLEVGRYPIVEDNRPVPAVLVQYGEGDSEWVVLRSVIMPWIDYQKEEAKINQALQDQIIHGPSNEERARFAIKGLAEMGFETGTPAFQLQQETAALGGLVRVSVDFLEEVLEALS